MPDLHFLVPAVNFLDMVRNICNEYEVKTGLRIKVDCLAIADAIAVDFSDSIVIARGYTAYMLKRVKPEVTIVEIPMSVYDILEAARKARKEFNAKRMAFIVADNEYYETSVIDSDFFPDIDGYRYKDEREIIPYLQFFRRQGVDAILCGGCVYDYTREMKYPAVLIGMGEVSVQQAIAEAVRIHNSNLENLLRARRMESILQNVNQVVISIDSDGHVTLFNHHAELLFHLSAAAAIGKDILDICPEIKDVIDDYPDGKQISVRKVSVFARYSPIYISSQVSAAVITMQEVSDIQRIEINIRNQLRTKGFIAQSTFDDVIGNSPCIKKTIANAKKFSITDFNVLLIGETGTGKEIFAQSIHNMSQRSTGPFVAVNCASLSDSLLESELFGYVDGAFTGANKKGKRGLFELANNGTIFLDEIGEISTYMQNRLLRVIEAREIMRLGDDSVIPVNIRIIAATNRNLEEMVESGDFRKDLLYRLDVLRLNIPPLRERGKDIVIIFNHFLHDIDSKNSGIAHELDSAAEQLLLQQPWDGNIREIRNICERLSVLVDHTVVSAEDISSCLGILPDEDKESTGDIGFEDSIIRRELETAIARYPSRKAMAEALGMDRTTLYRKLKKYGLL